MTAPRVGVGVLVVDGSGHALLTLRRHPPEAGCWSILGGRVETFEKLEHCAVREAREEAGIDVVLERLLCITDHILPMEGQHWVSPAYLARIVGGQPRNCEPDRTAAVQWFDLHHVPANLTLTAESALHAYLGLAVPGLETDDWKVHPSSDATSLVSHESDGCRAQEGRMTNPDDVKRASRVSAGRLSSLGIHLDGDETPDQLTEMQEAVERFEEAVESRGGDLMMDEGVPGKPVQPDDRHFALPRRRSGESVDSYMQRLTTATDEVLRHRNIGP